MNSAEPCVVVVMSTYNGAAYLEEQLASVLAQTGVHTRLLVRDDGSSDGTCDILDRWQDQKKLSWFSGPNLGPAASFMRLLTETPTAGYYAFADQDDIWLPDKLMSATAALGADTAIPRLYFSAKTVVDRHLTPIPQPTPAPPLRTFGSALVLSAGSGCTMVFTRALRDALNRHRYDPLSMHDHWTYKVCTAIGGDVVYDPQPHLLYRQHASNVISADDSLSRRAREWLRRFHTRERVATQEAAALLAGYRDEMPIPQRDIAALLADCYHSWTSRGRVLRDHRFRTGRPLSDLAFRLAVLTGAA